MDPRREQYRATQGRPFLRARLEAPGLQSVHGRVVDLSARGVGLVVPRTHGAPVERGTRIRLVFETLVLLRPIQVEARVARWEPVDDEVLYGLEFVDPAELERQIPFVLRREFNRRRTPRGRLDETVVVRLTATDGSEVEAVMSDLSTGGTGLVLEADRAAGLPADEIGMAFRLPVHPLELRLSGFVRGRRRRGNEVHLNVQFDERVTEDWAWQRSVIEGYVTERLLSSQEVREP